MPSFFSQENDFAPAVLNLPFCVHLLHSRSMHFLRKRKKRERVQHQSLWVGRHCSKVLNPGHFSIAGGHFKLQTVFNFKLAAGINPSVSAVKWNVSFFFAQWRCWAWEVICQCWCLVKGVFQTSHVTSCSSPDWLIIEKKTVCVPQLSVLRAKASDCQSLQL